VATSPNDSPSCLLRTTADAALRTDLRRGGSERIRGLERMAALHPAPTRLASAHVDAKSPDHRTHQWQLFLILRTDGRFFHDAPAIGTAHRRWRLVRFVDL